MGKADKHTKRFQEKLQRMQILKPLKNRAMDIMGYYDTVNESKGQAKLVNDLMKNKK